MIKKIPNKTFLRITRYFPTSSGASKQSSKRSESREWSEQSAASEQVSGASVWASGQAGGPVSTPRFFAVLNLRGLKYMKVVFCFCHARWMMESVKVRGNGNCNGGKRE